MQENRIRSEVFRMPGTAGQERPSEESAELIRSMPSTDADYLYQIGLELTHSGKFAFAIDLLTKALILRPRFPVAWYQKAVCQDHLDKREDALSSYDTCLNHDPDHAEAWFNRGMLLKKMGRHDEGNRSVKKAVDLCCGR